MATNCIVIGAQDKRLKKPIVLLKRFDTTKLDFFNVVRDPESYDNIELITNLSSNCTLKDAIKSPVVSSEVGENK